MNQYLKIVLWNIKVNIKLLKELFYETTRRQICSKTLTVHLFLRVAYNLFCPVVLLDTDFFAVLLIIVFFLISQLAKANFQM